MTLHVSRTTYGIYFVEVTAIIIGQHSVRGAPYKSDAISKWHIIMIRFIFTSVLKYNFWDVICVHLYV